MKFHSLALASAGVLVLSFTSLAQVTSIEGVVKGTDGEPLKGAVINIDRTDIKGHYPTKTDKKGHYIYTGLPIGTYNVVLVVDGKEVDSVKGVRTRPGDPIVEDFNQKQAKADSSSKQAEYQKALETGQVSDDLKRQLSPEQLEQLKKDMEKKEASMKKNAALNTAYNDGLAALNAKEYDKAIENLNKASEIDPNQIAVWSNLATAYTELAKTKTGADFDANMQKAIDTYSKALALKPEDAGIHNNFALTLARAKKFDQAQGELQKAAELDPQNAGKYYYNLGALLVNAGQNEAAGNAFKQAIEKQPTYADAYYQYGVTLVAKAQFGADGKVTPVPGTVEAFQKYLELAPTGAYAQPAKDMLTTLGTSVQTNYANPDAKKKTKK